MEKCRSTEVNLILGDCAIAMVDTVADDSVDLIVTSPPYADRRVATYGGIKAELYNEWFLERSIEFMRVLKPTGTFILNIRGHCENGERHTYVLELIIALRKQGWLWTEEFIWYKPNANPGKWPNRFKNAWERCLQFNLQRDFKMFQDAVRIRPGKAMQRALANMHRKGVKSTPRIESSTGSGFGKDHYKCANRKLVYPDNVLMIPVETSKRNHSAPFPEELPEWFIKLFTEEGDTVLDPFMGSGTTVVVASSMQRHAIGIEIIEKHYDSVQEEIKNKRNARDRIVEIKDENGEVKIYQESSLFDDEE